MKTLYRTQAIAQAGRNGEVHTQDNSLQLALALPTALGGNGKGNNPEQLLAAGCAAHGMLLAAHAQGLGAMWRTGELCYDAHVMAGLGLADNERIVGFLYLGSVEGGRRTPQVLAPADFVGSWQG